MVQRDIYMCEKRIEEHDKQVQQQNLEEEKDSDPDL